jgi:hypothetical protein
VLEFSKKPNRVVGIQGRRLSPIAHSIFQSWAGIVDGVVAKPYLQRAACAARHGGCDEYARHANRHPLHSAAATRRCQHSCRTPFQRAHLRAVPLLPFDTEQDGNLGDGHDRSSLCLALRRRNLGAISDACWPI